MTRPRFDNLDDHGVIHRPGCAMPGWTNGSGQIGGVHVVRCAGCGCVRLVKARK